MIVNESTQYLHIGATYHVVADGNTMHHQVVAQGNNKLMVGNGQNLPTTCVSCTLLTVSKLTKYNNLVIEFNALIISK